MCRQVSCSSCGRPTWAGCGAHIEQVLGHVPPTDRCQCGPDESADAGSRSWVDRLLGR